MGARAVQGQGRLACRAGKHRIVGTINCHMWHDSRRGLVALALSRWLPGAVVSAVGL